VYASALTRLHDAHAAQDVTQAVFHTLALKAKDLRPDTSLPGWLFTTTRYVAARYQRGEQRRQEREMRAFEQHQINQPETPSAAWEELRPHLAGALDSLSSADRETVLLRFYRQGSYRDVAQKLRTSEDGARKRVDRALEKLRRCLTKKGVTLSVTGLAGALTASASASPAGLAGMVSQVVLTDGGGTLAATETLMLAKGVIQMMFIAKLKTAALITATCAVVAGTSVVVATQLTEPRPATHQTSPPVVELPATAPVQHAQATPAAVPVKPAAPVEQKSKFTAADNGKTVPVPVGQIIEIVLLNGREGAGWEGSASEITGPSVERVNKLRRGNCDSFTAEKVPTPDTTIGMYIYRYRAVKAGVSTIRLVQLYPSGPVPNPRWATQFISEFKLTVDVRDANSPMATTQPIRLVNGLELTAFGSAQAAAPTKTRPTLLSLGVQVSNPTGQAQEFWPHKVQLLLRWGHGELRTVGINQNGEARVRAVSIPAGGTQTFTLTDARFSYGGKPPYMAFHSASLHPGAWYEEEVKGEADQDGFAFEYAEDHATARTGEIICRLVAAPAVDAPAVNEYIAQQTAQLWVTSLLQGRIDQVVAVSDVPFGWDKREALKTTEELKIKLEGVIKTKGVRNQQAGETIFLKEEEAAQAAERFKMLDTAGLVYVLVNVPNPEKSRGFDQVLLGIKPGNQLKVVGFSD
jgi:RNA polymerase sigma factor (sigma-70 family)